MQAATGMHHVYIIRSDKAPQNRYIGVTTDFNARLSRHNQGRSPHTAKFRPWHLETLVSFDNPTKAADFERYLKSGSGFAFAKKHL